MASATLDLPEELRSDRAWHVVLYILEAAFPNDPRVWNTFRRGRKMTGESIFQR